MDEDLDSMNEGQLRQEVQRLRGINRRNKARFQELQRVARLERAERKRLESVLHRQPRQPVGGDPSTDALLRNLFGGRH